MSNPTSNDDEPSELILHVGYRESSSDDSQIVLLPQQILGMRALQIRPEVLVKNATSGKDANWKSYVDEVVLEVRIVRVQRKLYDFAAGEFKNVLDNYGDSDE